MEPILQEERFDFLSEVDKEFISRFSEELRRRSYDYGGAITDGFCWGKYMLIYRKTGVKSKAVAARIYLREDGIVLRLFLNGIDKHRTFLENAPAHIQEPFTEGKEDCKHCKGENCKFTKRYTLFGRQIEKCSGETFTYVHPGEERLSDYVSLFREFYGPRQAARA